MPSDAQELESVQGLPEYAAIAHVVDNLRVALASVLELAGRQQRQVGILLLLVLRAELVEDVIVALLGCLEHHA